MKQFARLLRKFLESTQKENLVQSTNNRKWTLSRLKRKVFGKYLLVTNTLSSGFLMVAGGNVLLIISFLCVLLYPSFVLLLLI